MPLPSDVADRLRAAKGFVLDLDGTLVLGDSRNKQIRPLPGALEFIAHLNERGVPFAIMTNGTVRPPRDYVEELAHAGIAVDEQRMLTPSSVAADYLSAKKLNRVMAMGGKGVGGPLADVGLKVSEPLAREAVDAIFVGWFREFTLDHIEAACEAVWQGAKVFSASLAPFFATSAGRTLGTSCAIVGAISNITGCKATILGKPSPEALKSASRRLGIPARDLAVIGDDPTLEPAMARRGGAFAVGVTTGIAKSADFLAAPEKVRADVVAENIGEFLDIYSAL